MVRTRAATTAARILVRNSICGSQLCGRHLTADLPAARITAATADITPPLATADRVARLMADPAAPRVTVVADVPRAAAEDIPTAAVVDIPVVEEAVTPAAVEGATRVAADIAKAFSRSTTRF